MLQLDKKKKRKEKKKKKKRRKIKKKKKKKKKKEKKKKKKKKEGQMVRCDWAMARRPGYAFFEAYHKLIIIIIIFLMNK